MALPDPDPRVAGRGRARLEAAAVEVSSGVLAGEAARAHRGHVTRVTRGRPALTLKLARTSDGFAARKPGEPRLMISGEGAAARTHLMRAHADAIMVGIGTVLADDPRLDVRLPGLEVRSPLPVVLDGSLRTPPSATLIRRADGRRPWILCRQDADERSAERLRSAGADVIRIAPGPTGGLDLSAAMAELGARGLTRIFSEGGPTLAERLAADDLIDECVIGTNARSLGSEGLVAAGPVLVEALHERFRLVDEEAVGEDVIMRYERASCSPAS